MVGEEDHGVTIEELVRPARRVEQRADRGVNPLERDVHRSDRSVLVGCEVVVREVIDDEVEAVASHQPAADTCRVRVDGAALATTPRERRARPVRLEEVVEEEAARPVHGAPEAGDVRDMAVPAAVARDVDRAGDEARVLERLVDRRRVAREMALVHVDDRVDDRLREAGFPERRERRAVLDDPLLLPVPPRERRDVMNVGAGARRNRAEADRREGREDGGRAAVLAVRGEVGERGCATALDGVLERLRRHPVQDDQDELLRHWI